jgi:hypothetical protein
LSQVRVPSNVVLRRGLVYSRRYEARTVEPTIDSAVYKFGRTTGYTVGQVTGIDNDVIVEYHIGKITFTRQGIIVGGTGQAFSNAGDSGSLILQRGSNMAVALLVAGSNTRTIANHIDQVLKAPGVTVA